MTYRFVSYDRYVDYRVFSNWAKEHGFTREKHGIVVMAEYAPEEYLRSIGKDPSRWEMVRTQHNHGYWIRPILEIYHL